MTSKTMTRAEADRREHLNAVRRAQEQTRRRRQRLARGGWAGATVLILIAVAAMMLTSRPTSTSATGTAPDFTLATTTGTTVHLADYRGQQNVLLYFSEGAGCGSCITQMSAIEKNMTAFDTAAVTVLPIVMNTKAQITPELQGAGITTPFLLDDGTVSNAYATLGKGMHPGLPGHSFVLIDKTGQQRWHGEYPSMWLAPTDLLTQITQHLKN